MACIAPISIEKMNTAGRELLGEHDLVHFVANILWKLNGEQVLLR